MTAAPAPPSPRRVAITGSCVSRDTVEVAGPDRLAVSVYVARQSLISAGSDASSRFPAETTVSSAFQERMLRGDFAGDLPRRIADSSPADLVLWDIVDERHGVHVLADGSVVTRSVDALAVPEVRAVFESGRHVPFGDAEHYALWADGAIRLIDRLERAGMRERVVVLEVPWAERTLTGAPTPPSMGVTAADANRLARPYYARLRQLGLRVLEIDGPRALADPDHRWGLAPFHYAPDVYHEIIERLT